MGVTLAVVAGAVALAVAGVLLVHRATARRWLRTLVSVVVVLAVVAGGVQVWARLMLDESSVARALVWMESDTGDWRRFPSRAVPAGEQPLHPTGGAGRRHPRLRRRRKKPGGAARRDRLDGVRRAPG